MSCLSGKAHRRDRLLSGIVVPLAVLCLLPGLAVQLPAARARVREAEVAALIARVRDLWHQRRYVEAVAACEQILALDPRNDFAVGVLPYLNDKVALSQQRRTEPAHVGGSRATT